ncbi:MAG: MFS transporter [Proteobacteria bacterium]|nr:MAG: MFS transporter [Pseudomonadota bacterium]
MQKKYFIEFILFTSYMLFAMAWVGSAGFMKEIMLMTGMNTLAEASILSTALTFAKIIGTFIAAWTIVKFGIRNAFTVASILMCLSIVTPYATSFNILLISRFLMGLGGALVIVYFNPIVYKYFAPNERAVINGLNAIAFNVGTAIMMFGTSSFVAIFGSWQATLTVISILSVVMLILWLIFGKIDLSTPNNTATKETSYTLLDGLRDKFNWMYALTYSGLLAFYIVLFTFYPKIGITQTNQVILFGIIGAIAGMIYSNKTTRRVSILRISGLIQVISAFGLSFAGTNQTLAFVCAAMLGFFMFLPMPALVTYAQERPGMTAQRISVTFSLFWSISYLVATIIPTIFAKLVDMSDGNYSTAFTFICLVEGSFFIGSLFLRENVKSTTA